MGMPGPMEIIILVGMLGAVVVAVVVAVSLSAASKKQPGTHQSGNSNLFPCPDCGRLISVRAATCPHCGGPVTTK